MRKTLSRTYGNKKPCGIAPISNFGGLVVYEPEPDETETDFVTSWNFGNGNYGFHRNKLHYTQTGRAYLRKGNLRFYLDEIERY